MSTKEFLLSLARGARGKEAAKALILPQIFGGLGKVNAGKEYEISGTPPLSLPNSLGKPLKAWSVDVLPYQEGTGDPSPDNVRPIHGTDKLTITTAGKNLLSDTFYASIGYNKNPGSAVTLTEVTGVIESDGVYTRSVGSWEGVTMMSLWLPSGTYKCNIKFYATSTRSSLYTIDDNMTIARRIGNSTQSTDTWTSTITLSGDEHYIAVILASSSDGTVSLEKPQIEVGSTATEFEHFRAPSSSVHTLPQTVYTGTIGSEGGESRSAMVDMGDLAWVYYSQNNVFYALVTDKAFGGENEIMCEQYKPSTKVGFILSDYEISVGASNSYVYVKDPRYTTASDFKTAVSGVKLVYPLATPTTFTLPSVTIPTPTGTASTWATAEDGTVESMDVTYVGKA